MEIAITGIDLLFKELLIGTTNFFRDPAVREYLADVVLPELLARRTQEHMLRAWVIGCSTDEEAYSLAMVFTEARQRLRKTHDITLQIFASDLSPDAFATARRGRYPTSITANVSPDRLARFFHTHETHYRIKTNIRDMVMLAQHDVLLDPPFTKLDLIVCRNLLIYFDVTLQRRLLPMFHYSLRRWGVLLPGNSESAERHHKLFAPIEPKLRLYPMRLMSGQAVKAYTECASCRPALPDSLPWKTCLHFRKSGRVPADPAYDTGP